jgi:hypothetical protein
VRLRLNGWQRIGAILSIVWVIGAYGYVGNQRWSAYQDSVKFSYDMCSSNERVYATGKDCLPDAKRFAALMDQGHEWDAPAAALGGVPLGWLLAYGLIALWRWIARGFRRG